jgi:Initiator Replication protein
MQSEQKSHPVPVAKPSGNIFDTTSDCTLPLTQEITLQRVAGVYNEVDRKLWVVLIHLAFNNLGKKSVHETNLREIAALFREMGGGTDGIKWLMDSAKRLRKSGVDWEDNDSVGTSTLLASMEIKKATGNISYDFGHALTQKLLDNKQFTHLRVHFMLGLSGKYAVSLYMILEGLANLRQPSITIPLEELRDRLNVPEGKLTDWRDFNKFALVPALEQINGAENSGIMADYRTETKGRKIIAVTFTVVKSDERNAKDTSLSRKVGIRQANRSAAEIQPFSSTDYETFQKISNGLDVYGEEKLWRDWCAKTGKPTKNPVGAFIVWLQQAVTKRGRRMA